jgi:hypothetical protein
MTKVERVEISIIPSCGYCMEWVSEWLLSNANSVIFQLYHGENKLIFNEISFVLEEHA